MFSLIEFSFCIISNVLVFLGSQIKLSLGFVKSSAAKGSNPFNDNVSFLWNVCYFPVNSLTKISYFFIQILSVELSQENVVSNRFSSDLFLPENNTFNELLEILRDQRFQIFD